MIPLLSKMNYRLKYTILIITLFVGLQAYPQMIKLEDGTILKQEHSLIYDGKTHADDMQEGFDVTEFILDHLSDTYE